MARTVLRSSLLGDFLLFSRKELEPKRWRADPLGTVLFDECAGSHNTAKIA